MKIHYTYTDEAPALATHSLLPVLEAFSKAVVHCGPLGAGMTTKLARNAITYSMWAAVREATALADAGGVAPSTLLRVIEANTIIRHYLPYSPFIGHG